MVGGKYYERVLINPFFLERPDNAPYLKVHKGYAGVIMVYNLAQQVQVDSDRQPLVAVLYDVVASPKVGIVVGQVGFYRQKVAVEFVPGRGGSERRVRVDKGGHEEKGLVFLILFYKFHAPVAYPGTGVV